MYLSAHSQHHWKTSLDHSHHHLHLVEQDGDLILTGVHSRMNFSTPFSKVTTILFTNFLDISFDQEEIYFPACVLNEPN